jgi:hypothetical protein
MTEILNGLEIKTYTGRRKVDGRKTIWRSRPIREETRKSDD